MEIRIIDFVTVVASLASTGGIAAAGIRYLQRKDRDPKVIAGSLAAIVIVALVALLVSRTTTITVNNRSSISVPPVLGLGVATEASSVTGTPRPTSGPLPTSTPSLNAYPLLRDGLYNENVRLSCGDCDAPLLVTITQITVDSAHDEMNWAFDFYNHSGLTCSSVPFSSISFNPLTLTDQNGVTFTLTGPATTENNLSIGPGQSASLYGIFSFIAHSSAPYTLSAMLTVGDCGVTNYGPQVITV